VEQFKPLGNDFLLHSRSETWWFDRFRFQESETVTPGFGLQVSGSRFWAPGFRLQV